jgi:hypothetical protein
MSEYIPRLQEAITTAIRAMGREEMLRQSEGKWSIAQVLEHLYLTYTGTAKGCERALTSQKPLATPQTAKQWFKTMVVVKLGYYPRGIQAPAQVHPKGIPADQIVPDIVRQIANMSELLTRCEQRFGERNKLFDHPVLGALTAEQWRKFHWIHGQHHVQQILELRKKYSEKEKAPASAEA